MNNNHTFVICAYKESEFLEACIDSVMDQTVKSQVILYTSTPNDFISDLCEKHGISMFTKVGGGIGKDWNNALSFVETKYATIAHQDDFYVKDYAEKILAAFQKEPNGTIAFSDYREWKNGEVIPRNNNLKIKRLMLNTMKLFPKSRRWRNFVMAFGNPICCPSVTYDLEKLADFRFDEQMKVSLDWKAWYDISQRTGAFLFVSDELMWHRIHEESETSNTIADKTRTKEDIEMYQLFWPDWMAKFLIRFYEKSQNSNG